MRKRQLIIAEDDAVIVDDMKGRLESLGYEVSRTTPCAQEAVLLVQGLKPDLVLMDIQLPGEMDGIEAAEQIDRKSTRLNSSHVAISYAVFCLKKKKKKKTVI